MLVDDGDAEITRRCRPGKDQLPLLQSHVTGVRLVDAGQNLHQRALARAVLAHERMDLAGEKREVDIREGLDGAESLGDSCQFENRRALAHLLPTRRTSTPRARAAATAWAGARSSLITM